MINARIVLKPASTTTALTGQTINVTGTGYNLAAANMVSPTVNLGINPT